MINSILPLMSLFTSGVFLWLGHGLLLTYLPIGAKVLGFQEWQIGVTGSVYFLGFVTGCLLTPRLLRRVGHIRTFAVLAAIYAVVVLLLDFLPLVFAWLLARFIIGIAISGLYMVFESWLAEHSNYSNRGSILSVYSMLNLSMMAAGQQLLHLPLSDSLYFYLAAAVLIVLSIIPVSLTETAAPAMPLDTKINFPKVWKYSHVGLTGAVVSGLVTGAYWGMAPVFGEAVGMPPSYIALFMSASVLGGAVFQFPLGKLSDHADRRIVLQWLALVAAVVSIILAVASRMPEVEFGLLVLLAFFWGGACLTMYAISLAHANDTAHSAVFVEISSSMLIALGVGSALGAAIASVAMKILGPSGLYAFVAAVLMVFSVTVYVRRVRHPDIDLSGQDEFQTLPGLTTPMAFELDPRGEEDDEIQ